MSDTLVHAATVPAVLRRAAETNHGITLVDRNLDADHITYRELTDAAARTAGALDRRGVAPGDRVCLLAPTSKDLLLSLFGTWWAGAVPVLLPLPRRVSELDAYIDDMADRTKQTGARLLVLSELFAEYAPDLDALPAPTATPRELAEVDVAPLPVHDPDPQELAFLQFTSGTTARSRAVALSHRNLIANMWAAGEMVDVDPRKDVLVSWLPLFHDMGLIGMLFGAVLFRIPLVLEPTEEFLARPGSWIDAISRYGGTITAAPNFGYGLAARDLRSNPRELDLSSWRVAANGAEPVDVETIDGFAHAAEPYGFRPEAMCPMYGLAESTLAVSLSRPDEPLQIRWVDRDALETRNRAEPAAPGEGKGLVSCGHPIDGTELSILDPLGRELGDGEVGEICVKGPSVMQGYWRDPEGTEEVVHDGWLHTGDLGFISPDGLVVCGRVKDVIILGGRNLYPEDYEMWTERVEGVRRGNVIAFALPQRERMVVVAETTSDPADAEQVARRALETLRRRLPRGPEEVVLVAPGTLPKTSSGKRQRSVCRERYRTGTLEQVAIARR